MGRMVLLILVIVAVQLAMLFAFDVGIPVISSPLWSLFSDPNTSWNDLNLTAVFQDVFTLLAVGAVFLGTLVFKNDLMVFAGMAYIFYTFGAQLTVAWTKINAHMIQYVGDSSGIIASMIIGPIIFLYIFTVYEWWRAKD